MKIFLLYDEEEEKDILRRIIINNELGFLAGESNNSEKVIESIIDTKSDLVIIVLKDNFNRLEIIKDIKERYDNIHFIVIGNPTSKKAVEMAYRYGADYFIYKPINEFELLTLMKRVKDKLILDKQLTKIYQLVNKIRQYDEEVQNSHNLEKRINGILLKLGIIGEYGSEDLVKIVKYVMENDINLNSISIRDLCSKFTDNPRIMEQKMRRAINIALTNIASLGIEDYMNETFVEYSNTLFNFEQVKKEMDYLRGKSIEKGSISMKRFISGLCTICENDND